MGQRKRTDRSSGSTLSRSAGTVSSLASSAILSWTLRAVASLASASLAMARVVSESEAKAASPAHRKTAGRGSSFASRHDGWLAWAIVTEQQRPHEEVAEGELAALTLQPRRHARQARRHPRVDLAQGEGAADPATEGGRAEALTHQKGGSVPQCPSPLRAAREPPTATNAPE